MTAWCLLPGHVTSEDQASTFGASRLPKVGSRPGATVVPSSARRWPGIEVQRLVGVQPGVDDVDAEHRGRAWPGALGRAGLLVSTLAVPAGIAAALVEGGTGTAVLLGAPDTSLSIAWVRKGWPCLEVWRASTVTI